MLNSEDFRYYPEAYNEWRVDVYSNEVECSVTVRHVPTGITGTCNDSKSLLRNRSEAFRRAEQRIKELA